LINEQTDDEINLSYNLEGDYPENLNIKIYDYEYGDFINSFPYKLSLRKDLERKVRIIIGNYDFIKPKICNKRIKTSIR
jgi:hypothetical protein